MTETEGIIGTNPDRELSYGEKAVEINDNHTQSAAVFSMKHAFARIIDDIYARYKAEPDSALLYETAVIHAVTAQMWAVRAVVAGK